MHEESGCVGAGHAPLVGAAAVEAPQDAGAVVALGAGCAAVGRELLRGPQWVQKVAAGDTARIRTTLSPLDMDALAIPAVMQVYLQTSFKSVMHFTTDAAQIQDYQAQMAPMEGFEKKL